MIRCFLDTEFTGLHQNTTLISLGIISENDKTFYAEFNDYNRDQVDVWVRDNVISQLKFKPPGKNEDEYFLWGKGGSSVEVRGNSKEVAQHLADWFQAILGGPVSWVDYGQEKISKEVTEPVLEMWSDCLSYDWVLFNQLWGGAFYIPECVYYIPFDICTIFKLKDIDPDINREEFSGMTKNALKHDALWDARVIKACYDKLTNFRHLV